MIEVMDDPKTGWRHLYVEAYRSDCNMLWHFEASDRFVKDLREALSTFNVELVIKEKSWPEWIKRHADPEQTWALINSLYEVQGLKYEPCSDITKAIESLIAKYAELK